MGAGTSKNDSGGDGAMNDDPRALLADFYVKRAQGYDDAVADTWLRANNASTIAERISELRTALEASESAHAETKRERDSIAPGYLRLVTENHDLRAELAKIRGAVIEIAIADEPGRLRSELSALREAMAGLVTTVETALEIFDDMEWRFQPQLNAARSSLGASEGTQNAQSVAQEER